MEKIFYDGNNLKLCGILTKNSIDKVVVMCHGIRGNKDECGSFIKLSEKLYDSGYSSFRFDFNGHGESEGKDYNVTIKQEILDLENTIKMLNNKGFKEFILLGGSFGASIVSLLPYDYYECIKGLVLWYGALDYEYIKYGNLFTEENRIIAARDGFYKSKSLNSGKEFKFGLELFNEIDNIKPYEELEKNKLPKLFVHGDVDSAIPHQLSEEISKKCSNSKFVFIKNGEHCFKNSKESLNKAIDTTIDFIKNIF